MEAAKHETETPNILSSQETNGAAAARHDNNDEAGDHDDHDSMEETLHISNATLSGVNVDAGGESDEATTPDNSNDDEDDNNKPQDATVEPDTNAVDFAVTVHDDTELDDGDVNKNETKDAAGDSAEHSSSAAALGEPALTEQLHVKLKRRSKRGRTAQIEDERRRVSVLRRREAGLSIPSNQYEVTLIRRAVRKPDQETVLTERNNNENSNLEIYGDTTLGMNIALLGGRVVVQGLKPLADGRASPAQLVGLVQPGDVLLAINGTSLVNVKEKLADRVNLLNIPNAGGVYPRQVVLRFESSGGVDLLKRADKSVPAQQSIDPAGEMFALFPLVDQLSGTPLFEEELPVTTTSPVATTTQSTPTKTDVAVPVTPPATTTVPPKLPTNTRISLALANVKQRDRIESTSEYFTWNKHQSKILRGSSSTSSSVASSTSTTPATTTTNLSPPLSKEQFFQRGQRALVGAGALASQMERFDKGKDVRSFHSWNTTLSLYSRASTRRRYVLDAASLPVHFGKILREEEEDEKEDEDENLSGTSASDEGEQFDGDELLLRLAAHDEIWRKQVIEFLQKIVDGSVGGTVAVQEKEALEEAPNDFSSFLLGENISKILTERKKTQALPPGDVTAVLFDLTTKLSASVPDEITAAGTRVSQSSLIVPFIVAKKLPPPDSPVMLATQFLLQEALPVWAKTFKPLPWEQRRALWPLEKQSIGGSTAASTISDDDSLTVESYSTGFNSASTKQRKRRNLREQIEEQELDVQTREET